MTTRKDYLNQRLLEVDGHPPKKQIAKHLKMASDPFVFFRGTSQLFYADIKTGKLNLPNALTKLPYTAIMGDCHLSNFGFLTEEGSHGDSVIFAPNDFDDACIGPAVWDLARFAISLLLAARYGQNIKAGKLHADDKLKKKNVVTDEQAYQAMKDFISSYLDTCFQSASEPSIQASAINQFEPEHILTKPFQKALRRSSDGEEFSIKSSLAKVVNWNSNQIKFIQNTDKFKTLKPELYNEIEHVFAPYVDDSILDIVLRLGSGTGSLNMSRFYLLVGPKSFNGQEDLPLCHIVEVKQQRKAAPLYHFDNLSPVNKLNPAHLTVNCQRRMQRRPDLVLDEVAWQNQFWLVRSRHHTKVGIDPEDVVLGKKATTKQGFNQYARECGKALALAHCRGDRRSNRFESEVAQTLLHHQDELVDVCIAYAKQVAIDTNLLRDLLLDQ